MNLLNLYHRSPYPVRVAIASARGYYLRWWRFGRQLEAAAELAREREQWSAEQWRTWREERLAYVLDHAATQVPYYRALWEQRRRAGDRASWELLENWPRLSKEAVRQHAKAFIADDFANQRLFTNTTSGTSGTPLNISVTRAALQAWHGTVEARMRGWYGLTHKDRWAIIGGQLVVPFAQKTPPFWVENKGLRQLYLSSHHISYENAPAYLDALQRYQPGYMIVYPSSAHVLAQAALERNQSLPAMKAVFSNAERLLPQQRETISAAFNAPVIDTYGMGENLFGASECPAGTLHTWPDAGVLEVWSDNEDIPVSPGNSGRFILTGLLNPAMPFIRYEVGDRGQMSASETHCSCGRTLPALASIEGRLNDLLITADGRQIFWINPIFYGLPLREAQIIQESLDRICVRYVPAAEFSSAHLDTIRQRLRDRMGAIQVQFSQVDLIPRTANGKF
ncbi:MAG: phenylacetate--CoA ligase family protein, partial [Anaerolineales bacterium]|nr:phenylacetate--CoA ligase family protein [Anaerolineales bacterium]